jgi:hypothetical protein
VCACAKGGLYRSSSKGYRVYRGGGGGGRLIPTKKLKKLQSIAEISTPPHRKKSSFLFEIETSYHIITQLLLLSDKIF